MSNDTPVGMAEISVFILERATTDDLDRMATLARQRHTALREQASADVRFNSFVELADLKPAYLNKLRGTVTQISPGRRKKHVTVRLDSNSVTTLALASNKYAHILNEESYELPGIPIECCRTVQD